MIVSAGKEAALALLAKRMGVGFEKGAFTGLAKKETIEEVAFSIAQCASMAMYELVRHSAFVEDDTIRARAGKEVDSWCARTGYSRHRSFKASGEIRQYSLDFVIDASPRIAIDVLIPTVSTVSAIDRYTAQVLDLRQAADRRKWRRIAVLGHPQLWNAKSRIAVGKLCDGNIAEIADPSDSPEMFEQYSISAVLDSINRAA